MDKIDFVFPYVDMRDEIWQESYKEERRRLDLPTDISKIRYRSWDNLKYLLRSIAKNAPWAGKVHMIVSNREQVPDWIDTTRVNIVLHEDIIPEEYLPTFNSCTIEMFLGNIPGLSERFIYLNDDIFILRPMKEKDFFENNVPKLSVKKDKVLDTMFKRVEWGMLRLIGDYYKRKLPDPEKEFLKIPHTATPIARETVRAVNTIFKPEIRSSISSFRKDKNFNQYLYTYYQLFSGVCLDSKRTYKYVSFRHREHVLDKAKEIAKVIRRQGYDTLCINDCYDFKSDVLFDAVKKLINSSFEEIFPKKCKYELCCDDIYEKKYGVFKWLNKIGARFTFRNKKEIRMFVEGVISVIDEIRRMRDIESSDDDDSSDDWDISSSELSEWADKQIGRWHKKKDKRKR